MSSPCPCCRSYKLAKTKSTNVQPKEAKQCSKEREVLRKRPLTRRQAILDSWYDEFPCTSLELQACTVKSMARETRTCQKQAVTKMPVLIMYVRPKDTLCISIRRPCNTDRPYRLILPHRRLNHSSKERSASLHVLATKSNSTWKFTVTSSCKTLD